MTTRTSVCRFCLRTPGVSRQDWRRCFWCRASPQWSQFPPRPAGRRCRRSCRGREEDPERVRVSSSLVVKPTSRHSCLETHIAQQVSAVDGVWAPDTDSVVRGTGEERLRGTEHLWAVCGEHLEHSSVRTAHDRYRNKHYTQSLLLNKSTVKEWNIILL